MLRGGGNRCVEAAEDGKWDLFVGIHLTFTARIHSSKLSGLCNKMCFHISFITAIRSERNRRFKLIFQASRLYEQTTRKSVE